MIDDIVESSDEMLDNDEIDVVEFGFMLGLMREESDYEANKDELK